MLSSWTRDGATRTGERRQARAQTSPVAALAALFAVCAGLSLYVTVLGGSVPLLEDRAVADPTLDRVHDVIDDGGVVDAERLPDAMTRGPDGRRLNVTLTASDDVWTVGPAVPQEATDRASRLVSVRLSPGQVEPGRLTVVVWS
ncbi:DUF7285 family protein [Halogeometricum borinquense]|uniref:DUF7285 family protein n=1 Tax=Halogeometricum borinquense TaxID=60847 RepID=UPI003445D660